LVIGWLCGTGLAFGLVVVLRPVPWPAVVHWLRSPTGLYVQVGTALVFELSGGALVPPPAGAATNASRPRAVDGLAA
jgi:hypothetical protein